MAIASVVSHLSNCIIAYYYNIIAFFFFFFSLFHQRADYEALTRFLQTSLFLVASPILFKSMFFFFRSSLTWSIQVLHCLPLLLFPSTCPRKAAFGNLFSSILSTCPNHCSLLFLIFCTTVSSASSSSLVCSFLTFSLLLLPMILLSQLIPATITASFARPISSDSNILSRTARLALPGRNKVSFWLR